MEKKNTDLKVTFPIAAKLMLIIGLIVVVSLGTIIFVVNFFDSQDVKLKGEDTNFSVNKNSAGAAEHFFKQQESSALLFMDMLNTMDSNTSEKESTAYFFERNPDFGAVALLSFGKEGFFFDKKIVNKKFFQKHESDASQFDALCENESVNLRKGAGGESFVVNTTGYFGFASVAVTIPWHENGKRQALVFLTSTESLSDNFGGGNTRLSHSSCIVNAKGDIIVHSDFQAMQRNDSIAKTSFFKTMNEYNDSSRQFSFKDEDGTKFFCAYQRLPFGGLCVITTIKAATLYEGIGNLTRRNILLMVAILFLAILFIWLYAKTISNPLKALTKASEEIENGNFDISVKSKSHDEISALAESFNKMSKGLSERARFRGKAGSKVLDGDAENVGEEKSVTVLYFNIRNFAALSQLLSPQEIVGFLNDCMTKMATCITRTNGTVDKFIAESFMAVWGTPSPAGNPALDALNSVISALLMRSSLIELNKSLASQKRPAVRIGCGINSGTAIAGEIGTEDMAEYTVIGDNVSLASRIEALNKPFGSDILITESTYKLISKLVTVEEMPSVQVHGRAEPLKLYAVVNMPKAKNIPGAGAYGPKSMDEVRKLLGIPKPDLSKVNTDVEEKKYKID
ncbi:MAG: HAMP domain-containing protein [Treponema sp.]|nr:HAMP domain-containing protein [Treponema sp.]